MASESTATRVRPAAWPDYAAVWRWHFYAGLLCMPFIVWLASTGALYLFKPQVEAWLDAPYEHLQFSGPRASAQAQIAAALDAVPGGRLKAYELPRTPQSAVQILVATNTATQRVYVHPQNLLVLHRVVEEQRLMPTISHLHGELLLGDRGSLLVELAASWAIVMIISGLYLWWPRNGSGLAGVLYPRVGRNGRVFWRDLHAVIGLWVSMFALLLLLSGLPWTKFWGSNLKELRQYAATTLVQQDWTTGSAKTAAPASNGDEHSEHAGHQHHLINAPLDYSPIDRLLATVAPLNLAPPVLIAPPGGRNAQWTARSDAQNRPLRVTLTLDGNSGAILKQETFSQRPLLDRIIGTGIAAHEGQLFGWFNQVLGLFTALGLITIAISGMVMWWKRKPGGVLGAPSRAEPPRFAMGLVAIAVVLSVLLPLFGLSLLLVLLLERVVLRRIAPLSRFLGLHAANSGVLGSS